MSSEQEFDYQKYEKEVENQIKRETLEQDIVWQSLRLVTFISRSNGRGKNPRPPREVTLLVPRDKKRPAYQVIRGEIRSHGSNSFNGPDRLAASILTDTDLEDRTPSLLLERVKRNFKIEQELKSYY